MKSSFRLFDNPYVRNILREYVSTIRKLKFVDENFVLRRAGSILRFEYFAQDFVDWWDVELDEDYLKRLLKKNIYYKAVFKNILEFSSIYRTLKNLDFHFEEKFTKVYYINFENYGNFDKLRKSFSKNVWKNVRHSRNTLNKTYGHWSIEREEKFDEEVFNFTMKAIYERHRNEIFKDEQFKRMLLQILRYYYDENSLGIWILKAGDEILCVNYVFEIGGFAFSVLVGYDKRFDVYRLLIFEMVKYYFENGFKQFNFMKGESRYKSQWTKDYYKLYRLEMKHPSITRRLLSVVWLQP